MLSLREGHVTRSPGVAMMEGVKLGGGGPIHFVTCQPGWRLYQNFGPYGGMEKTLAQMGHPQDVWCPQLALGGPLLFCS